MSDTKISEAAERLERAYIAGMDEEFRDDLRVLLDALPHLYPHPACLTCSGHGVIGRSGEDGQLCPDCNNPAELAEQQRDSLTALVVKWRARQEEYDNQQSAESKKGYEVDWTPDAKARSFESAADELEAALAATGKQQVGAFPWENLPSYLIDKCEGDTISEEGIQRAVADMAKDARYCPPQQVGEVQGSND